MMRRYSGLLTGLLMFTIPIFSFGQELISESRMNALMRIVGHEFLLKSGDSTSRVLPIERSGYHRYGIGFETAVLFEPAVLSAVVDSVMKDADFKGDYLVEMEQCRTEKIIYSYEIKATESLDVVPCIGREQVDDCYHIHITLLNNFPVSNSSITNSNTSKDNHILYWIIGLLTVLLVAILVGLIWWLRKKTRPSTSTSTRISIGHFEFDPKLLNLNSKFEQHKLTNKEAALLQLLYESQGSTVEKSELLSKVWGDEGDYVGRTLDVYISKLRKKLSSDESIKIINQRGVGYKLVIDVKT